MAPFRKVAQHEVLTHEIDMLEGSCHCGAVRFQVPDPPQQVTDCNCSICRRLGVLWAYYSPGEVTVFEAGEATTPYVHGDRTLAFHHCRTCGCTTHWSPLDPDRDRMGVNARLFDPEVLAAAKVRRLDGAETWEYLDE
ncbi:MAG TPA: GFA family protein [Phenylobacterium sp.]